MKKFVFCLIVGAILLIPMGVSAWSRQQIAKPIVGADCRGPFKIDKYGYPISDIDPNGKNALCSVTIYVFDDAGNKCYVVKGSNANGISCVKGNQ